MQLRTAVYFLNDFIYNDKNKYEVGNVKLVGRRESYDYPATVQRVSNIDNYLNANVANAGTISCYYYSNNPSCQQVAANQQTDLSCARAVFVGAKYDLSIDDKPLRVIESGLSSGNIYYNPQNTNFFIDMPNTWRGIDADNYIWCDAILRHPDRINWQFLGMHEGRCLGQRLALVQELKESNPNHHYKRGRRDNHMYGVTMAYKLIYFGINAIQPNDFGDWNKEFIGNHIGDADYQIFNLTAGVNYLRCSVAGKKKDGSPSKADMSNDTMRRNCAKHYIEILKILEPNLVIGQSTQCFENVKEDLNAVRLQVPNFSNTIQGKKTILNCGGLYKCNLNNRDFYFCNFVHPAVQDERSWSKDPSQPYFQQCVVPAIEHALSLLGLPRC